MDRPTPEDTEQQRLALLRGRLDYLPPVRSLVARVLIRGQDSVTAANLTSRALPRLRKYCRERYGLDFLSVDVDDGGIVGASVNASAAMVAASEEVGRFASVLPVISDAEFARLREALGAGTEAAAWLESCYRRDDNSRTPEWLLQTPEQIGMPKKHWLDQENRLSAALRRLASHQQQKSQQQPCQDTSTTIQPRLSVASSDLDPIGRFDIEIDIRQLAAWSPDCSASPERLEVLARDYVNAVTRMIDSRRQSQSGIHCAADALMAEVLQHSTACSRYLTNFRGREEVLSRIRDYLTVGDGDPHYRQLPLIVHGPSGSGKTSVLARAAASAAAWAKAESATALVLLRFLGTSPDTSGIRHTLRSLVCQLAELIAHDEHNLQQQQPQPHQAAQIPPMVEAAPQAFKDLVAAFYCLLERLAARQERRVVCVFLDSIDQLDGSDGAFHMAWLRVPLPPGVRLVLSTLPDPNTGILAACRSRFPDPVCYVAVEPAGVPLCREILLSLLSQRSRQLTEQQWAAIDVALAGCSLPIYATLLANRAALWRSYDLPDGNSLKCTVREAVCHVFDQLVASHGSLLTRHSLAYITASRNGLTESELEDLLSLDDLVLAEVVDTYPRTGALRFPSIRWTRLRQEIGSYLADREADGARVLNWYHRQFKEAAAANFLADAEFARWIHSNIADYFLGKWAGGKRKPFRYPLRCRVVQNLPEQSLEDRLPSAQPYVLRAATDPSSTEQCNLRKLSELPWHLAFSEGRENFYRYTTFDLDFLHYKLKAAGRQQLLIDLELPLRVWGSMDPDAQLVYNAIRLAAQSLASDPAGLGMDLLGRLLDYVAKPRVARLLNRCRVSRRALARNCLLPRAQCFDSGSGALHASFDLGLAMGIVMPGGRLLCFSLVSNDVIWYDLQGNELKRISCEHNLFLSMKYLSLAPISKGCIVHVTSTRTQTDAVPSERTFELLRVDLETGSARVVHTFPKDLRLSCDGVEAVTETHLLCAANKSDTTGRAVWRLYSVADAAFVPLVEGKLELECRIGAQNFYTDRRLLAFAFEGDDGCELALRDLLGDPAGPPITLNVAKGLLEQQRRQRQRSNTQLQQPNSEQQWQEPCLEQQQPECSEQEGQPQQVSEEEQQQSSAQQQPQSSEQQQSQCSEQLQPQNSEQQQPQSSEQQQPQSSEQQQPQISAHGREQEHEETDDEEELESSDWRIVGVLIDCDRRIAFLAESRPKRLILALAEKAAEGRLRVIHMETVSPAMPSGVRYSQNFCSARRDRLAFLLSVQMAGEWLARGLIWHVAERRAVWLRVPDAMAAHRSCVSNFGDGVQAKFSEDGRLLLTSGKSTLLMAWSAQDGTLLKVLTLGSAEAFLSGQPPGTDYFVVCHFPDESAGYEDRMFIMAKVLDLRRFVGDAADADAAPESFLPIFRHKEMHSCVVTEPKDFPGLMCVVDQDAHVIDLGFGVACCTDKVGVSAGVAKVSALDLTIERPLDLLDPGLCHVTIRRGYEPPTQLINRDPELVFRLHRALQEQKRCTSGALTLLLPLAATAAWESAEAQVEVLKRLYGLRLKLPSEQDEEACCNIYAVCHLFDMDSCHLVSSPLTAPIAPVGGSFSGFDSFDFIDKERRRVISVRSSRRALKPCGGNTGLANASGGRFCVAMLDVADFSVACAAIDVDRLADVGTDEQPAVLHQPEAFLAKFRVALASEPEQGNAGSDGDGDGEAEELDVSSMSLTSLLRRHWHKDTKLAVCAVWLDKSACYLSLALTSRLTPSERLRRTGESIEPDILWLGRVVRANLQERDSSDSESDYDGEAIKLEFGSLLDLGPAAEFLPSDGLRLVNYKLQVMDCITGQVISNIRPPSAEPLYFVRICVTTDAQLVVGQAYSPAYRVTFAVFDEDQQTSAGGEWDESDMFAVTPPRVLQVYRLSDGGCLANYMFESDPLGFCLLEPHRRELLVLIHNFPLMLMTIRDDREAMEP